MFSVMILCASVALPLKSHAKILASLGVMAFTNSLEQGDAGPEGSTILTQAEVVKQFGWFGLGLFSQFDLQGSSETDFSVGPKIEVNRGPFYIEGGYMAMLTRSFTDRSVAEQSGFGWLVGVGARFSLGGGRGRRGGGGGMFLQFSYKFRIQHIKQNDGVDIPQSIIQKDGYPLFGVGLSF